MENHKQVCTITPVAYRPYQETGEFACFGVVLHCPTTGVIKYKLGNRGRVASRVHAFFREIDTDIFKMAVKCAKLDIEHTIELTGNLDENLRQKAFSNLVRPREGVVHFCKPMAIMTDDIDAELNNQFELIVERSFVDREGYYEQQMRTRVKSYLDELKIAHRQQEFVCDDNYKFSMPFAIGEGRDLKAIKPLNFIMKTPVETKDHWLKWGFRFAQLQAQGMDKNRLFVTVRLPSVESMAFNAAMRAYEELKKYASVVREDNLDDERREVLAFAS